MLPLRAITAQMSPSTSPTAAGMSARRATVSTAAELMVAGSGAAFFTPLASSDGVVPIG